MNASSELEQPEPIVGRPTRTSTAAHCRFCEELLRHTFVDLGMSPLCETYLKADRLNRMDWCLPAIREGL